MSINYLTEKLLSNHKETILKEYDEEIFFNTQYASDDDKEHYLTFTRVFKTNENEIFDYSLETQSISIESLEQKIQEAKSVGANFVKIDSLKGTSGPGYVFEFLKVEVSNKEDIINHLKQQKYSQFKKISELNSGVEELDREISRLSKKD